MDRLRAIFKRILLRMSDPLECIQYKRLYRTLELAATETQIEDDLYESLEYHDIMKEKLKDAYRGANGGEAPLPSQLFALLKKWLTLPKGFGHLRGVAADVDPPIVSVSCFKVLFFRLFF